MGTEHEGRGLPPPPHPPPRDRVEQIAWEACEQLFERYRLPVNYPSIASDVVQATRSIRGLLGADLEATIHRLVTNSAWKALGEADAESQFLRMLHFARDTGQSMERRHRALRWLFTAEIPGAPGSVAAFLIGLAPDPELSKRLYIAVISSEAKFEFLDELHRFLIDQLESLHPDTPAQPCVVGGMRPGVGEETTTGDGR